ncbi:MAG: CDP-archaeol synthase [Gammaproteobacteria bacterium]|nr:CDP-archaeol synthase [Gammaproteobacteria bacterium]
MLLKDNFNLAVDFGKKLPDRQRVFGRSKTWRGILAALVATAIAAWLLGYFPQTGMWVAGYAILGDLFSSFIKRRMAMAPSSKALLLDQIPESLLPALMLHQTFHLNALAILLLVALFIIIELALSQLLYNWNLRRRPY